jgi:hypothetical protein
VKSRNRLLIFVRFFSFFFSSVLVSVDKTASTVQTGTVASDGTFQSGSASSTITAVSTIAIFALTFVTVLLMQ